MLDMLRNCFQRSENWNVVVDLGSMALSHALGNPHNVATLLLLQLEERVEDAIVKLLHEPIHVQLNLQTDAQVARLSSSKV